MSVKTTEHELLHSYGNFVMSWNHVELTGRNIIQSVTAGKSVWTSMLTAHIGNVSVTEILKTGADYVPNASDHFKHYAALMDTIRPYRNYYVHCMIGIGTNEDLGAIGLIMSYEVRKQIRLAEKALQLPELNELLGHTKAAASYGLEIIRTLEIEDSMERFHAFKSLEKPVKPKPLAKKYRDQAQLAMNP